MDDLFSPSPEWRFVALRPRPGRARVIRRPWHRTDGWSPQEAAAELHERQAELVGQLRRRSEARGVPVAAQEEIVIDAITAVVMESAQVIANEQHLLGAFWRAVDHRCKRHREGRHSTRLGSRARVDFDTALEHKPASSSANPFDSLEQRDRFARAADLMADLDERERQVVAVMASHGVGPVPTARLLNLPLGEVRSAVRSANAKLDRVAAIAAAGRMCQFRAGAITADAAGEATEHQARMARAHVSACVPCGRVYRKLRREMRGREFQRSAVAAFLPLPAVSFGHVGSLSRLAEWIEQRVHFLPSGGGERATEVLGGAGVVKVAAAGTALVVAGSTIGGHLVHDITAAPTAHRFKRSAHIARHLSTATTASIGTDPTILTSSSPPRLTASAASPASTAHARTARPVHHSLPKPPSKSLGYLALGGSSTAGSTSSSTRTSSPARATVASVSQSLRTSSSEAPPSSEASPSGETSPSSEASPNREAVPQPSHSGGGSSLNYLGQ
jgi:DNA-directed RNA polymerase specialized sigma24 family protein